MIYVIIVTYNGAHWVENCFGSLAKSTTPVKVLAIDNASTDGTAEKIRQLFPDVELIASQINLGFGKANNIGFLKALEHGADYFFLLNQDAWIEPDTIEQLVQVSQARPEFGILSPLHLNGNGTGLDANFEANVNYYICPNIISDTFLKNIKSVYATKFVNAAAWLVTVDCIKKVGGFDPIFSHYSEDNDYINRTLFHGFSVGIVPKAIIYHDRTCKSSRQIELDPNRLVNNNIVRLKRYPNTFTSNFIGFLKEQMFFLVKYTMLFDLKRLQSQVLAFVRTIFMLKRIIKAKKMFVLESSVILLSEKYE
ncbi:MAG: glycosyltransferase family 2 protein [Methylomonas sp.]|jgi:GT2 family glycosyltransferase